MEKPNCKNCKHRQKNKYASKHSDFVYFCTQTPFTKSIEDCESFSPTLYTKTKRLVKSILTAIGCTTYDEPEEYLEN